MSITQSKSEETTKEHIKMDMKAADANRNKKLEAIQKMNERSEQFNEDAKTIVTLKLNVAETLLFPADFYIDFEDLYNEAIAVKKMSNSEAADYAEKNFRVRRKLEQDSEDPTRTYPQTTYKVKLPNSTFPDMVRQLKLSSKPAIEEINKKLMEVAQVHDGPIAVKILKKQTGASKFNVKWEISAAPWTL